jgi:hypothetical protein
MQSVTPARSRRLLSTLIALVTAVTALVGVVGAASSADARPRGYIVLTPGDHGSRVVSLQRYLHVRPASGYFGSRTRHAVIRWQARHHRHRTGLVGKRLWRAVQHSRSASRRAPAPSRGGDRVSRLNWRALARCESGGNPRAVNPAGYYGLYQEAAVSPATPRRGSRRCARRRCSVAPAPAPGRSAVDTSSTDPAPVRPVIRPRPRLPMTGG